jgi:flavin-dependent dehydrogenase
LLELCIAPLGVEEEAKTILRELPIVEVAAESESSDQVVACNLDEGLADVVLVLAALLENCDSPAGELARELASEQIARHATADDCDVEFRDILHRFSECSKEVDPRTGRAVVGDSFSIVIPCPDDRPADSGGFRSAVAALPYIPMGPRIRTVAIIGGGPAGSALGFYLARAGLRPVVFDRPDRPPLVVGESLVPAVVPFLRELGIEEEVREYGVLKPGATFVLGADETMQFDFSEVRGATTRYAYNVPRDRLDASITDAAVKAGVTQVPLSAAFERLPGTDRVRLSEETLDRAGDSLDGQPDLIVDATGRSRAIGRLLDLPVLAGDRSDTALFAHCDGVGVLNEGHVHTDLLEHGWSWRIPLPDRMSVGLVMDSEVIESFGGTSEERFDNYLAHDPMIARWGGTPSRRTRVFKYNNYQQVHLRGVGEGWALVGDAFGFVDPVFSSGMLIALDGARALAGAISGGGGERRMRKYEARVLNHVRAWQRTIDHFYNGRLFSLFRAGDQARENIAGRLLEVHFGRHLPRVFTGEATARRYSVGLMDFMCRHGLLDNDPAELAIR